MLSARSAIYLLVLLSWAILASAQGLAYRVDIDAPRKVRELLRENLDLVAFRENERMQIEQLRALIRLAPENIRELLAAQGYFQPTIETELVQDGETWVAKVRVDPGEPARVTTADISIQGPITNDPAEALRIAEIRAAWSMPPGTEFTQTAWESAKRGLLRPLVGHRFPAATIQSSQARVDPKANTVTLSVVVDSGQPHTFGPVVVSGLQRYQRDLVMRYNPTKPGMVYDQEALLGFQRSLIDSGYFETAFVSADVTGTTGEQLPVQVTVKERPSQRLSFGVGASTDTGARFHVQYDNLNLGDRAWRLNSELRIEQRQQLASAKIQLPPQFDGDRFSFGASLERTDIRGEQSRKLLVNGARVRIDGNIERALGIEYAMEAQDIAGFGSENNRALYASYTWTQRALDNPIDPRAGYYLLGSIGGATEALASTQDFLRLYARSAILFTPRPRHTFTLRGEVGAVFADSRSGIPTNYLWRTGGDNSIRGYAFESIGVPLGDAIVGGRRVVVGSAQYLYRITEAWGAVVFYDVGSAADSYDDMDLFQGVGVGGRYQTPVGAVGLDVAYGIERSEVRLHFSLGFTF